MGKLSLKQEKEIRKIIFDLHIFSYFDNIQNEHRLRENLGFEELDLLEMWLYIEDFIGISFDDTDFKKIITVEDVFRTIELKI